MLKLQYLSGLAYTKYNIIKGIVTVFYYIHYAWYTYSYGLEIHYYL